MRYTTEQLKELRKKLNNEIQDSFNKQGTYKEKLIYIYKTVLTSQNEFLKYVGNTMFDEDYVLELINEINTIENLDDSKFIDFVQDKIISPIGAGHLYIKPDEVIESQELITKREEYIREHENEIANEKNVEISFLSESPETVIIKVKSFSRHYLEKDKQTFEELQEYLSKNNFENVIIDIRGNSGGTDEYFEYLSMFTSEPVMKSDDFRNLFTFENESVEWTAMKGGGKDYNRYLLVDDKVFSTAESLAMLCKKTGFATIIGEPTKGEGYGATPFTLHISDGEYRGKYQSEGKTKIGMNIVFPIEAPINARGEIDYVNFYKTHPDIVCPSFQALEVAMQQIEMSKGMSK